MLGPQTRRTSSNKVGDFELDIRLLAAVVRLNIYRQICPNLWLISGYKGTFARFGSYQAKVPEKIANINLSGSFA